MTASDFMLRHRYGWRAGTSSTDTVGEAVVADMFGEEPAYDIHSDPEYIAWRKRMDEAEPVEPSTTDIAKGVAQITAESVAYQVKKHLPYVHSYDIRGGRDSAGNNYAVLTIHTTDPHNVLKRIAEYALKTAGAKGVSVITKPATEPGQVVLVFSKGSTPEEFGLDDIYDYLDEGDDYDTDDLGGGGFDSGDIPIDFEDPFATVQEGMRGEVDYLADTVNDEVNHVAKVLGLVLAGAVAAGVATAAGIAAMLSGSKRFVKRIRAKIERLERRLARAKKSKRVDHLKKKVTILKGRIDSLKTDIDKTEALAATQEQQLAEETGTKLLEEDTIE